MVAAGFGALTAMSFAPLRLLPMLAIGLSGLTILLHGSLSKKKPLCSAFWTGSAFGTLYFAAGMFWLANAFLVQADAFAWLIPIVLPLFFFGLGLFFALSGLGSVWAVRRFGLSGLPALVPLILLLAVTEWLRGHILTGLPWNLYAQGTAGWGVLLQPLAAFGPYAYGLVLVALSLVPAAIVLNPSRTRRTATLGAAGLGAIILFGGLRLTLLAPELRDDTQIVVVQPSVPQRDKLDAQKRVEGLRRTLDMTEAAAARLEDGKAIFAIWPENAYPFIARIPELSGALSDRLPAQSYVVTGSIRATEDGGFANTFHMFGPSDGGAPLAATYDKHRLVPFGETLPFYSVFEALGIEALSPVGDGGFTPGTGPARIDGVPAPFAPLICYEDVFPGTLYPKGERPEWLVVVTNDAWFGDAAGPMQHLDIARMRAIETGLPIARSANTGISAVIDSEGRVLDTIPLYTPGTITSALPVARPPTLYTRAGDLIFWAMVSFIVLMVWRTGPQVAIEKVNHTASGER
nr:apolipoprotein N-acyltransferase [Parvularcula mediterranea]